tara:strand:- start:603 stop:1292 length:690 start_codon:yes stop_codon:yes gene_type:complete
MISVCVVLGGSSFIPSYLLWDLENKINLNLPKNPTGIILLGGSFNYTNKAFELNQVALNGASERIVESLYLLNKNPDTKLIMVANRGSLKSNGLSEAAMASLFFRKFNIDEGRLHIKPLANNTYQESVIISEYIDKIGGNWILVTSASHMPRAINLFQSRKLKKASIFTYPTDYSTDKPKLSFDYHLTNLGNYSKLIHEYLGLFGYWITGRTTNFFPDSNLIPINQKHI